MSEQPTKVCSKCNESKALLAFPGRQATCLACRDAAKARTLERKDQVAYSDALAERIVDALAAGMTVAEVTAQTAMPTSRQLRAWRRGNPDFDAACEEAEQASAAAHLDKAKRALADIEAGKVPSSDGRVLFDGHMKLAATLNPKRYGSNATIDVTSAGRPLVDFAAAVEALIAALPVPAALPAPTIEAEATDVPEGTTLQ